MTVTHLRNLVALLVLLGTTMLATSVPASPPAKHLPIAGNWNPGNQGDEPGFYNTETGTFFLCTTNWASERLSCPAYDVPLPDTFRVPLLGRWSANDTIDRPALYNPSTGTLLLFRFSDCLPGACDGYGGLMLDDTRELGILGAQAVSGDWDSDGIDTVALIVPASGQGIQTQRAFARIYRAGHHAVLKDLWLALDVTDRRAIAGRWPETNTPGDSLGFFHAQGRTLLLFDGEVATSLLSVAGPKDATMPFSGRWVGDPNDGLGLYTPIRPDCSPGGCHRVNYQLIAPSAAKTIGQVPHPHLDSRFPDDPGGPGGPDS